MNSLTKQSFPRLSWTIIFRSLSLWLPIAILVLAAVFAIYRQDLQGDLRVLEADQRHQVEAQIQRARHTLKAQLAELMTLAQGYELTHWPDLPSARDREVLVWQFAKIIRNKGIYDQVRFLDLQGQEVVRVDLFAGQAKRVPDADLQDKSGRYYFSGSIGLKEGEVFVSRFDLNQEHGQIEMPIKPTLRLATPVYDSEGHRRGVLVINFLGSLLLHGLASANDGMGQPMLLDSEGYWLKGLQPDDEWGFMYPGREGLRFQARFPEAWKDIAREDQGQVLTPRGLFTFATLRFPDAKDAHPTWKIVFLVPPEAWSAVVQNLRQRYGLVLLVLWLAAAMAAWLLACSQVRRRQSERALRDSEQRTQAILNSAADGIITLDRRGTILGFNPAAERIFGYVAAEVLGQGVEILIDSTMGSGIPRYLDRLLTGPRRGQASRKLEITGRGKDGGAIPLEIMASLAESLDQRLVIGIVRDVSARKQAEMAIKEEQDKLRLFVENAPVAMAMFDRDMRYMLASPRWISDYHLQKEQLLGHSHYEVFPDIPEPWRENNRRCLAGEVLGSERDMFVHTDGSLDWVRWEMRPWRRGDGEIGGLIMFTEVITDKVMAEDERERFFNLSSDLLGIAGVDGFFKQVNPAWENILGFKASDLLARPFLEMVHPEDRQATRESTSRVLSEGEISSFENRFVCHDGSYRWISWNALALPDQGVIYAQGRDVTEKRLIDEALREREERLRAIVEHAVEGIITIDDRGVMQSVNPAAQSIFGYRAEEMVGQKVNLLQPEPYRSRHDSYIANYLRTGIKKAIGMTREVSGRRKDGSEFPLFLSVSEVRLGDRVMFTGILRDFSELKRAQDELRQAKEVAEAANRAKSDFLASMSHEIRTPMNAIIGMAELLSDTPLNDEQHKYVQTFQNAGENLLCIINDILDLSKVEAGQMTLEQTPFNLPDLVETACELIAAKAQGKGLEMTCRVPPEVPALVVGDPTRLRQVLVNLLGNAIKFTELGEINLMVEPWAEEAIADKIALHFMVRDTGIGIPSRKIGSIFESFTQADTSVTRKFGGTGLGLTICQRLVGLMGGRVWVESREGHGSTFHFTAQFEPGGDLPMPASPSSHDVTGLRVLVVDDNATNRQILTENLTAWGALVTAVDSGQGCLEALRAVQQGQGPAYDLVLLDYRMPDLDGLQVARAMQIAPDKGSPTVVMLSSDNQHSDAAKARELGIRDYLVKPIKRAELKEAIIRALGREPAPAMEAALAPGAETAPEDTTRPLRILLVDDSADNRLLVQSYLKKTPHQVQTAENGQEAVEKFRTGSFDLVLMDIQMPVLDGYSATREIRRWETGQGLHPTPIIALTAYALEEERLKSLEAGCSDHLAKPIKKKDLLGAIARNVDPGAAK